MNYIINDKTLTAWADALRTATGRTETLTIAEMTAIARQLSLSGIEINFDVVGGTTEPTNPLENTVWINTNTSILGYHMCDVVPTWDASEGIVDFLFSPSNSSADGQINLLKTNEVSIKIISCYQYTNGEWVEREFKIYQNGEWVKPYNPEHENSWHLIRTATINSRPIPSDFVDKTISAEDIYSDSSIGIAMNIADSYSAKATTYLFFNNDINLSIAYTTDDDGSVYINDTHVGNLGSCTAATFLSPFRRGWNKVEICYTEGSGGDGWNTSPKFSSIESVQKMYAKI